MSVGLCDADRFLKQVPRLEIPVYIFQGRFDYQVSYSLAVKEFADTVKAPVKGFLYL